LVGEDKKGEIKRNKEKFSRPCQEWIWRRRKSGEMCRNKEESTHVLSMTVEIGRNGQKSGEIYSTVLVKGGMGRNWEKARSRRPNGVGLMEGDLERL